MKIEQPIKPKLSKPISNINARCRVFIGNLTKKYGKLHYYLFIGLASAYIFFLFNYAMNIMMSFLDPYLFINAIPIDFTYLTYIPVLILILAIVFLFSVIFRDEWTSPANCEEILKYVRQNEDAALFRDNVTRLERLFLRSEIFILRDYVKEYETYQKKLIAYHQELAEQKFEQKNEQEKHAIFCKALYLGQQS